jgi:hypothetical protein
MIPSDRSTILTQPAPASSAYKPPYTPGIAQGDEHAI